MAVLELPNSAPARRQPGRPCPHASACPKATTPQLPPAPAASRWPAPESTSARRAGGTSGAAALACAEPAGCRTEPDPQPCPTGEEAPGAVRGKTAAQSCPGTFQSSREHCHTKGEERDPQSGGREQGEPGTPRGATGEGGGEFWGCVSPYPRPSSPGTASHRGWRGAEPCPCQQPCSAMGGCSKSEQRPCPGGRLPRERVSCKLPSQQFHTAWELLQQYAGVCLLFIRVRSIWA